MSINSTDSRTVDKNNIRYKINENMRQIYIAMTMPEIYMVIFYFLLSGFLNPDFGDFGYYFLMNVCQISKF
jgi:hypothetical protein